ncbi:MAG: argininosuccinate synthase [Candidatus Margulisiibacteriota bacterium]|nr:MAG: argininosuccinate synthase [Candidatus Margulisbacteria bacterium GWD2_39_127]OGI04593.1 MAG: argininosuccinate synthase [Candidatus Margulisbacteria bacterium GWF2_38_17]OGI11875.1 MAG: argininosuccinate synthase [Candidatus Margulisbacteria bacterium GWE2_39_32]PZM83114.1 MAG: argininosuccinate synthase [Candidatus Margulisiibacteriota bacterium]HAR62218.1 argininosuccinate synthase [Candidatus Margulisiibacteriota bacterium]
MSSVKKVVLAYSGGLDTSVIIPWLKENYGCEVIAFAADVGQGEELDPLNEKAIKTGASKIYIEDLKEEFVRDYIFPTLRAGAIYEDKYLLGTSFARPLIAKKQIEIAEKEGADAVSHGATGKGNDQVRFELTYMALNPHIKIIAPWKDDRWTLRSREDAIAYAEARNIPLTVTKEKIYSEDRNIWHVSHEGGELEDPWNSPLDRLWAISSPLEKTPDQAEYVEIEFEKGNPVAVNGNKLSPFNIVATLNGIGGKHGVGQIDLVENRLVGMKSRGVYETPGGTILYAAHQAIESLVLDKETYHYKQQIALKYADLVYNGQWFTQIRESLDAFVTKTQEYVTGVVRFKLYKGNVILAGVKSPYSLYHEELATFSQDEIYNQKDAIGFIKLFGLPLKVDALLRKKK